MFEYRTFFPEHSVSNFILFKLLDITVIIIVDKDGYTTMKSLIYVYFFENSKNVIVKVLLK